MTYYQHLRYNQTYKQTEITTLCMSMSVCLFGCLIITQEPLGRLASNFDWGIR